MPGSTATLALDGEITLSDFAAATKDFYDLLRALSAEVSRATVIDWLVESLEAGSASITARGESDQEEEVERTVEAYLVVGRAMESNRPIPYRPAVQKPALRLASRLNGHITAIRFETPDDTAQLFSRSTQPGPALVSAYGAVEGRVQTVTSRHGLRFTLFESLSDRAVNCYLRGGQEELMRQAWGSRAIVEGLVARDPGTSRPVSVRNVTGVTPLEEVPSGTYRQARGILPIVDGGVPPEVAVRRVRDA